MTVEAISRGAPLHEVIPTGTDPTSTYIREAVLRRVRPRVAYLGPPGTFTWEVATAYLPGAEHAHYPTIGDVVAAVVGGDADMGVIPLVNSLEGPVGEAIDSLATATAYIHRTVDYRVRLCIGTNSEEIRVVYTHPHAAGQARKYLSMLNAEIVYTASTGTAVEKARECGGCAAIATEKAVKSFKKVQCGIEDTTSYTRFALIGRHQSTTGTYTSIIFTVPNRPGALYRALTPIAKARINMTLIYSRPTRQSPWDYYFYIEIECGLTDEKCRDTTQNLAKRTTTMRALGSYDRETM